MEKPKKVDIATAIADFRPTDDESDQICLEEGDFIEIYNKENDDWWYGEKVKGKVRGWFPASYVKVSVGKVGNTAANLTKLPVFLNPEAINIVKGGNNKPPISPKPKLINSPRHDSSVTNSLSQAPNDNNANISPKTLSPKNGNHQSPKDKVITSQSEFESKTKLIEHMLNKQRKQSVPQLEEIKKQTDETLPNVGINGNNNDHNINREVQKEETLSSSEHKKERHSTVFKFEGISPPPNDQEDELDGSDNWEENQFTENKDDLIVVTITSYQARGVDQLTIQVGDVIQLYEATDSGWCHGKVIKGIDRNKTGWFPVTHVKSLGKEYHHFGQSNVNSPTQPNGTSVTKSNSNKWLWWEMPKNILVKAAVTTRAVTEGSLWYDSSTSLSPSPKSATTTTSPSTSRSSSMFYATPNNKEANNNDHNNNNKEKANNQYYSDNSFDSDDSDYGTDQTSLASYSQLYTIHTMTPNGGTNGQSNGQLNETTQKRLNIIFELLTTEESYINDLYFTLQNFRNSLYSNGLLTEDEMNLIFRNLDQIYEDNYELYNDLNERLQGDEEEETGNTRVCDILLKHLPQMIPHYKLYCSGQSAAVAKVNIKCSNQFMSDYLKQISAQSETFILPLTQYLAKPLQRIMKYPFLIEQLLKSTPSSHIDHSDCERAFQCAKSFCKEIDDRLHPESHQWEPFENLSWLQTHIVVSNSDNLIDFNSETQFLGPRELLHSGFLMNTYTSKTFAAFLFNDLFILAVPKKRFTKLPFVSSFFDCSQALERSYSLFRKPFLLNELIITDRSENQLTLDIYFGSINCHVKVQATNHEQYKVWIEKIYSAKQNYANVEQAINERSLQSASFVTSPIAFLSLTSIEAVQLYTRNYTLNAYCKIAMGQEWSQAHTISKTKSIQVNLNRHKAESPKDTKLQSATKEPPSKITWEINQLINIHSMDDQLFIRCFDENRYAPHQFLGETCLSIGEIVKQSRHLKDFTKGLPLRIPNEELSKRLLANYQINPCLLVKFDIL